MTMNITTLKQFLNDEFITNSLKRIKDTKHVPIHYLSAHTLFFFELGVDIMDRKVMCSPKERQQLFKVHDDFLTQIGKLLGHEKLLNPGNISNLFRRLKRHWGNYQLYKPQFVKILQTQNSKLGAYVYEDQIPNEFMKKHVHMFKRMPMKFDPNGTVVPELAQGKLIPVTTNVDASVGQSIMEQYGIERLYIREVENLKMYPIPYSGLTAISFVYYPPPAEVMAKYMSEFKWFDAYCSILSVKRENNMPVLTTQVPQPTVVKHKAMITGFRGVGPKRRMLFSRPSIISVNNKHELKSGDVILIDDDTVTLNGKPADFGWGEIPLNTILSSIDVLGSSTIPLTATSRMKITLGDQVTQRSTIIDQMKMKRKEKFAAGVKYYATTVLAGKAQGKSSFMAKLEKHPDYALMFIEDSDDYGAFLTYLTIEKQEDIEKIAQTITHQEVLDYVVKFYEIKNQANVEIRSLLNLEVEGMISLYGGDIFSLPIKIPQHLDHYLLSKIDKLLPKIRERIVILNGFKNVNQRTFQQGIQTYMLKYNKVWHIALLHYGQDTYHRIPSDELVQYLSVNDTQLALLSRAISKAYPIERTLADISLQTAYMTATDYSVRIVTPLELAELFSLELMVN